MQTSFYAKRLLKRLLPAPALHAAKRAMLDRITDQMLQAEIAPYDPGRFPFGLNLIGPIDSTTGLGQSLRLLEHVISCTQIPYLICNYRQNTSNRVQIAEYAGKIKEELQYSINLWHVNPSEFAEAYAVMGKRKFDGRYNIAYWLWELEDFPDEWVPYIHVLDEIWTPSEFISEGIRRKTDKPVYTVPYCVTAATDTGRYGRAYFGLPEDAFLFLTMYDSQSIRERKNPDGVIRAFQSAFSADEKGAGLVIKVNSAGKEELDWLKAQIGSYSNIYVLNQNLEKVQVNSLIAGVDVLVSLHRAEGFGLVLAESMLNHVPVIATNWSANTEFMDSQAACMVNYQLKTLEHDILPYRKGNRWADPDLEEAARYMKRLASDPAYYEAIAQKAYAHAVEKLGMDGVKPLVERRLREIRDFAAG